MIEDDLKAALAQGAVVFGSRSVMRLVKTGKPKAVVLSKNCPDALRKDAARNAALAGVPVETFGGTGKELGVFCGKPFPIAALAIIQKKAKQ